jgi:hypothetical protein
MCTCVLPVLLYSFVLCGVAINRGHTGTALAVFVFQVISIWVCAEAIFYCVNHWLQPLRNVLPGDSFQKSLVLCAFWYFVLERNGLVLFLKMLSLLSLHAVFVWNKGLYDNDSFLLFYLVLLLAHAVFPYLSVQFMEKEFPTYRNLPVPFFQRMALNVAPAAIFFLPEFAYVLNHASIISIEHRIAYYVNAIASLLLLTAVQYSGAASKGDYVKACFALFFVSVLALLVQAFWWWIGIQITIGTVLLKNGYYNYEGQRE